ncbi:MAG: hypothetical protein O3A13_15155 [Proteobacteria bacterium]|nr:hypothetical protein [Pseudomonadota bacterium]MDA0994955.1 hypothetical protein [Pseudomonadota bacterium]
MLDPLIIKAISIGLGLMFLFAAYHKLSQGAAFRVTLLEYQLLPDWLVSPASRIIPIIEILLGASWLISFYDLTMTAIGSATLLGIYALAISVNLYRGRVHFDCGCSFGGKDDSEQFLSFGLVLRNLVLIATALVALMPTESRAFSFADYATLTAILLTTTLLFAAANQLISNRAAINTWRKR